MEKNPPTNAGNTENMGLILGLGSSPGEGNGNSLQDSCLENSMERARGTQSMGVAESDTIEHTRRSSRLKPKNAFYHHKVDP